MKEKLLAYAHETYKTEPDHPFQRFPTCAALRHTDNHKIYAMFMDVQRKKLEQSDDPEEYVDILNIKVEPELKMMLSGQKGIRSAYHMHAGNWITVLLDGSVSIDKIIPLLDLSYDLTSGKSKNGKPHNPYWIVPANLKYYDIEKAIADGDGEFLWKQSNSIHVGDTVYLYVAAPVSAIRYECKVLEADIPYPYSDKNVSMTKVMRLRLLNTFAADIFSISTLRSHGVTTVRGPRSVPASLLDELRRYADPLFLK
ncbi:MAG: MmcQ/YjbR family DNA-binding protein [Eubacteriales bacterium]|nr:MmcQ/YjbR family DNA-binding protein [Eubacteriales bacterium]